MVTTRRSQIFDGHGYETSTTDIHDLSKAYSFIYMYQLLSRGGLKWTPTGFTGTPSRAALATSTLLKGDHYIAKKVIITLIKGDHYNTAKR